MLFHFLLKSLFPLIGGGNVRLYIGNINLALVTDCFGQRFGSNFAAQDVVRSDIRKREIGITCTGLVMSVADKGIDSDYWNAAVDRLLERTHQLDLVSRGDKNRIRLPADNRVEHRYLLYGVELRCA